MSNFLITEEEINKILLSSPMILPLNPAGAGLKGDYIKELFYKHIRMLAEAINQSLFALDNKRDMDNDSHNGEQSAHPYLLSQLSALKERDIELGNQIASQIKEHNESASAHTDIREMIVSALDGHNADRDSHPFLYALIEACGEVAHRAYETAIGKARIIPVKDAYEMLESLDSTLSVGDRFILAEENVPDFTLFAKDSTDSEAIPLSQFNLLMGEELKPGKKYISNGYLLVASESGIDTSLFARAEELNRANTLLENKAEKTELIKLATTVDGKENKLMSKTSSEEIILLEDNIKYSLGLRTAITLSLPENIDSNFYSVVTFRSGVAPTELNVNGELIFAQDDTLYGELIPVSNRIYELYIRVVEGIAIANVCATDYEVIE